MTFKEFQQSGRLSPVNDDLRIKMRLSPNCSDIIRYNDGTIIQSMETGGYLYSEKKSSGKSNLYCSKLDSLESIIFNLKNKC